MWKQTFFQFQIAIQIDLKDTSFVTIFFYFFTPEMFIRLQLENLLIHILNHVPKTSKQFLYPRKNVNVQDRQVSPFLQNCKLLGDRKKAHFFAYICTNEFYHPCWFITTNWQTVYRRNKMVPCSKRSTPSDRLKVNPTRMAPPSVPLWWQNFTRWKFTTDFLWCLLSFWTGKKRSK